MRDADKTKEQLIAELTATRQRVTELEGLNHDRLAAERTLSEAEQLYRNILDNAVAGFFQTTPDGRYLVVNYAMARIFGYNSPLEMTEQIQDARRQIYVDPCDRDDFEHLLTELGAVKEFEYQAYRKDGSTVWVSDNARVVCDQDGKILYYEGNTIDISERKAIAPSSSAPSKNAPPRCKSPTTSWSSKLSSINAAWKN
ncbi:MAG: PAS domain S-box protein [Spirulinaceae cyanobacterium RM2_2_10]|nr:PAS domain S-box protein [Spirulinaceae cyanobacterium RM2_2_10]